MKFTSPASWLAVALTLSSFASEVIATSSHNAHIPRRHSGNPVAKNMQRAVNSRRSTCKPRNPNDGGNDDTPPKNSTSPTNPKDGSSGRFPSLDFDPPEGTPTTSLDKWWVDQSDEQGFFGFTYGVFACQSKSAMMTDFKNMRTKYKARYIRVYGECPNERATMFDDIVDSAYANGMGVYATVWLGWDAADKSWKTRMSHIENTIKNNPRAPYTIRTVDVGSEPLLDQPVSPSDLLGLIKDMKAVAEPKGIQVGISEMRYAYSKTSDSIAKQIFAASDYVHAHQLHFLSNSATTGEAAWASVQSDIKWFAEQTDNKKKIVLSQTGWPTNQNEWKSASKKVDDSVSSSAGYFKMLSDHCADMKKLAPLGGVGWFFHTYRESDLSGWGLLKSNGQPQFDLNPVTSC